MLQLRIEKVIMARKLVLIRFFVTFVMFFNYSYAAIDFVPPNNPCMIDIYERFGGMMDSTWISQLTIGQYCIHFMYLPGLSNMDYRKTDFEIEKLIQEHNNEDKTVRVSINSRNIDNKKKLRRIKNKENNQKLTEEKNNSQTGQDFEIDKLIHEHNNEDKTVRALRSSRNFDNIKKSEEKNNEQTDQDHSSGDMIGVKDNSSTHQHEIDNSQKDGQTEDKKEEKETDNFAYDYFLTFYEYLEPGKIKTATGFCTRRFTGLDKDCLIALEILNFGDDIMENLIRAFYILTIDDYIKDSSQEKYLNHIYYNYNIADNMPLPSQFCKSPKYSSHLVEYKPPTN